MEALLNEKEQKELYPHSHTIGQGTPNNEPEPTFEDSVNNYEQLLIDREGSLKPDRYSLIDEWRRGDLGGALNQNIDQWFVDKWEGLGPDNQQLILDGIEIIKAAKKETKSNWIEYPVESSLWHAIDFIGGIAGPVYQAGTTVTANVGERAFGINRELIEKANSINQLRTGKVLPFLPTKIPGVSTSISPLNTKAINPVQVSKPPTNVTNYADILNIIDGSEYSTFNRAKQISDLTTGGLGPLTTPFKSKQTANVGNIMYTASGGSAINWTAYGYKEGVIPSQVQNASRVSPEVAQQVAADLDGFYTRVDRYITSREGGQAYSSGRAFAAIKKYPMYWRNPHTGGLYKAAWNAREKRLTVRPVTRGFLENQQSSMIQKYANKLSKEQIAEMNAALKTAYQDKVKELTDRLAVIDADMPGVIRHAGSMGKDGSSKSAVMNSAMSEREGLITQLENITQGKYYTEHGYYLNSEKIRNQVVDSQGVPIGESTEFQLGDRKNQNPVFEPGKDEGFSALKTRVETAIDSLNEGFYLYPNLVVNYNPALSGEREYIIRIEDLSTVKMGRDIKGVLSGKPILEINYNDTELVERLSTTDGIREWLAEKGIEPAAKIDSRKPDPIRVRDDRKPTTPLAVTREKLLEIANRVFDERVPRTVQGLLGFEVPEYEVVKRKLGRPLGSKNKPKPDQLKLDL